MSKVPETYLYSVINNRTVIKLDNGVEIRSPRSLYLTKDDVLKCMKTAYVYRRFADGEQERVTTLNLDRVHNSTHYTEKEWKELLDAKAEEPEVITEATDTTVEEETPVVEEPVVEDEIIDAVTVEESEDPVEEVELTSTDEVGVCQEDSEDDTVEEIDSSNVEEGEVDSETDVVEVNESEEDKVSAVNEDDNEMGVSTESESNTQANTAKYNYKKKKNYYKKH